MKQAMQEEMQIADLQTEELVENLDVTMESVQEPEEEETDATEENEESEENEASEEEA